MATDAASCAPREKWRTNRPIKAKIIESIKREEVLKHVDDQDNATITKSSESTVPVITIR